MNESWSVWHGAKQVVTVYWPVIISLMLVGGLVGVGLALRNPTTYTARAELITGNYSLPAEMASQPAIAKWAPSASSFPPRLKPASWRAPSWWT